MNKNQHETGVERASTAPLGVIWWNRLPRAERHQWLARAGSARPVDAWAAFQSGAELNEGGAT